MSMLQKSKDFLLKYGMHYSTLNMEQELNAYVEEMSRGLDTTDGSSLMMLPTYLSVSNDVPYGEPILVIDAGGTHFRVAVVTLRKGEAPLIEDFKKYHMPGSVGTITREEFFDTIADRLLPVADRSQKVGFCFSYPAQVMPNKDGKFIEFSKEISVEGMKGAILGEEINKSLAKHGVDPKQFLVLNDTVAAMLGGIAGDTEENADGYIGFILGTGTNTCYPEKTENIRKDQDAMARAGEMAVNMESGGYGLFPRGAIDERFDQTTNNPGQYKFEKMVSGAYLGGVLYELVAQAVEEGLFSEEFALAFPEETHVLPLWEVDKFLDNPGGGDMLGALCHSDDDRAALSAIFTAMYQRAAALVAIELGAIMTKTGRGSNKENPCCIVAEGTTFEKSRVFREKLDGYVKEFLNEQMGLYCRFLKVEDATLLGTAVAGLIG